MSHSVHSKKECDEGYWSLSAGGYREHHDGQCYLELFSEKHRGAAASALGYFPDVYDILVVPASIFRYDLSSLTFSPGGLGVWHVRKALYDEVGAHVQLAVVSTFAEDWPVGSMGYILSGAMDESFGDAVLEDVGLELCDMVGSIDQGDADEIVEDFDSLQVAGWPVFPAKEEPQAFPLVLGIPVHDSDAVEFTGDCQGLVASGKHWSANGAGGRKVLSNLEYADAGVGKYDKMQATGASLSDQCIPGRLHQLSESSAIRDFG